MRKIKTSLDKFWVEGPDKVLQPDGSFLTGFYADI